MIESDDYFTLDDENVQIILRAKYMHGLPMKGTAIVSISEKIFGYNFPLAKKTVVLDGRETIEFNIQDELKLHRGESSHFIEMVYEIKAEITETITGITKFAEKTITITENAYKITTDLTNKTLKQDSTANVTVGFINNIQHLFS